MSNPSVREGAPPSPPSGAGGASSGGFAGSVEGRRDLAGLTLIETSYAPAFRVESHAHRHTLFAGVLDGRLTEVRGGRRIECPPGTLIVQPPEEPHAHDFDRYRGGRCFSVVFGPEWIERMGAFGLEEPDRPLDLRASKSNYLLGELRREYLLDDPAGGLVVEGHALALLGEVSRSLRSGREAGARPGWLLRAVDYLREHFRESIQLAELAAAVDVHPVTLSRTFKRYYGSTMGDYLRALRVDYARRLLQDTTLSLSQVALEAGFSDQAHLTRVFRAGTGLTPGAFRRHWDGNPPPVEASGDGLPGEPPSESRG